MSDDRAATYRPRIRLAGHVPNVLSVARLVMAFAFFWVPPDWRLALVVSAALSDFLDGAISRMLHATSTTGRILDPIADKCFVLSVLATLWLEGQLNVWHILLIGARDLAVLTGIAWVIARQGLTSMRRMPPSWLGKLTTALQFLFIVAVLYWRSVELAILVPTAICSACAGVDYLRRFPASSEPESSRPAL